MVSTNDTPRDSLRETLPSLRAPQRRTTAPAAESAETGQPRGVRSRSPSPVKLRAVRPNPSLKRSANGRPPGPVWRYAVHFRQPGPSVLPSSPA